MSQTVDLRVAVNVATVTLNRPRVLNAMNLAMHEELRGIWDQLEADDDVRVVVLAGAGGRAFSVGQDLTELVQRIDGGTATSSFGSKGKPGYPRLTERFSFAKPIIAAVDGYALGGGFELALACDVVVATTRSEFALPEARLGLIAGAGGVFRLTRQAPFRVAMGYLMTGRRMSAERAHALGVINDVVDRADLDACVQGWVDDMLACAPLSLRAIKEAAVASESMTLADAFAAEYRWERVRMQSRDAEEGPRSFAEKRPPIWSGT